MLAKPRDICAILTQSNTCEFYRVVECWWVWFDHKIPVITKYVFVVSNCGGITYEPYYSEWTLRSGTTPEPSSHHEVSMLRTCFGKYYLLGFTAHKAYY